MNRKIPGLELKDGVLSIEHPIAFIRWDQAKAAISTGWIGDPHKPPPPEVVAESIAALIQSAATFAGMSKMDFMLLLVGIVASNPDPTITFVSPGSKH